MFEALKYLHTSRSIYSATKPRLTLSNLILSLLMLVQWKFNLISIWSFSAMKRNVTRLAQFPLGHNRIQRGSSE